MAKPVRGPKIKAGACRFAAGAVRLIPEQDPAKVLEELVRHCRMRKASHVSWACRLTREQGITDMKGDGGESGAGNVILDVLRKSSTENILVAVARWYGGKRLGGLRFRIYRKLTSEMLAML
ncbi:MAG: YigZ family protein [Candidatus Aegiribacteria sp.]|nr:YigZ family protein [Candidatus Aegiribacteria sp.]